MASHVDAVALPLAALAESSVSATGDCRVAGVVARRDTLLLALPRVEAGNGR